MGRASLCDLESGEVKMGKEERQVEEDSNGTFRESWRDGNECER